MLAVGAGRGCLDIFSLIYHFFFLSPSLWETARYRLKYCLKGPLSPKQPTNQRNDLGLILTFLWQGQIWENANASDFWQALNVFAKKR